MPMLPGRGVGLVVFNFSFLPALDSGASLGSGASRSSTPRLARVRMRAHRTTSIEHPSSTTAAAKHPPSAGPKGTASANEGCDGGEGLGMGGEGAGNGATGGDSSDGSGEGGGGIGDGDMAG